MHFSVYFCAFSVRIDCMVECIIFEIKFNVEKWWSGEGAEPPPQHNEIKKYMHFDWIKDILSSRKCRTYVNITIFARQASVFTIDTNFVQVSLVLKIANMRSAVTVVVHTPDVVLRVPAVHRQLRY